MNILDFLEKEIQRKIKLVNLLYQHHTCPTKKICDIIDISFPTLKQEFTQITQNDLPAFIVECTLTTNEIAIQFKETTSLMELNKVIYQKSKLLSCIYFNLLNKKINNQDLAKFLFTSASTVAKINKRAKEIVDEIKNDIQHRFLLHFCFYNIPEHHKRIHQGKMKKAMRRLNDILDDHTMYLHPSEKLFLQEAMYISLQYEKRFSPNLDHLNFSYMNELTLFIKIKETLATELEEDHLNEEAIIMTILCHQYINCKDFSLLQTTHKHYWEVLTLQFIPVYKLYFDLITLNNQPIIDEIALQKAIIKTFFHAWIDLDCFSPHYIIETQDYLFLTYYRIMQRFEKQLDNQIHFDLQNIQSLFYVYQHELSLFKQSYTCNIVVKTQEQFTIFYHFLDKYLNHSQFQVNSTIFYSLSEIPEVMLKEPYITFCVPSLNNEQFKEYNNIFPISLDSLSKDVTDMVEFVLKEEEKKKNTTCYAVIPPSHLDTQKRRRSS